MKKLWKYFSFIIFGLFFFCVTSSNSANALYDRNLNTTQVSVSRDKVQITVKYQKGINQGSANYYWCQQSQQGNLVKPENCINQEGVKINYINIGGDPSLSYIAKGDSDNNPTTYTFTIYSDADPILKDLYKDNGEFFRNKYFTLIVRTDYCARRNYRQGDDYRTCEYWEPDADKAYTSLEVSMNDLQNGLFIGGVTGDIADEDLNTLMSQIESIVNGTVMPILWAVLGLFLIIKGTITGVQIVKSADEPQVRQEKISSLKWLVIGTAIAYGATFAVSLVIGFFENVFKGGN